ncbi:hypothetical protein [Streptomyces sp. NPDC004296]
MAGGETRPVTVHDSFPNVGPHQPKHGRCKLGQLFKLNDDIAG